MATVTENYREALSDISALAEGYDGFESPEDLRSLIDDMANVAVKARNQKLWSTRITPKKNNKRETEE